MDKFVHIFTALPEIMVDVLIPSSNPISKTFFWALEKLETTKEAYATPANAIIPCEKQTKILLLLSIVHRSWQTFCNTQACIHCAICYVIHKH